MICGNCDKTDGLVYTSLPPKVRCEISKHFHEMGDECEFEWKPIIHGHWIDINENGSLWECSICGDRSCCSGNYCMECGAKMDEVKDGED